jgi:hypothetical protein
VPTKWSDQFEIRGGHIAGLTPIGRATVRLLNMMPHDGLNFARFIEGTRDLNRARYIPPGTIRTIRTFTTAAAANPTLFHPFPSTPTAAADAGIHRNTIANWRQTQPGFTHEFHDPNAPTKRHTRTVKTGSEYH